MANSFPIGLLSARDRWLRSARRARIHRRMCGRVRLRSAGGPIPYAAGEQGQEGRDPGKAAPPRGSALATVAFPGDPVPQTRRRLSFSSPQLLREKFVNRVLSVHGSVALVS